MSKKIIIFLIFIFSIIFVGIYGIKDIKSGREKSISQYLPNDLKTFLKKTIFIIPSLQKTIESQNKKIKDLELEKIKTNEMWSHISNDNITKISFKNISSQDVKINNSNYKLSKFLMPLPDYYNWEQKSVGYIDKINDDLIFVSGDGNIFINKDKNYENKKKLNFKLIESNILDFLDKETTRPGKISIKDILIKKNNILISYNFEKFKDCYNVQIVSGVINENYINFKNLFSYDECYGNRELHSSGGRIVEFSESEILFSIGEGLNRRLAQDKNSIFGKIIKLNLINKDYEIVSMGHRNPQGLYFDKENNKIFSTEHGPSGGDEINIIKQNLNETPNYGWPISSYGDHYPGRIDKFKKIGKLEELLEEAPFNKSHKEFGFVEPLKYYTPSIGISEIIKIPSNSDTNLKNLFLVGAMGNNIDEGDKSLHYFNLDENNNIKNLSYSIIGERVRDLLYFDKYLIMVLENSPSLGFLKINNK